MLAESYLLELYVSLNSNPKRVTADKMKPGKELLSMASLYFLALLLTLGSADYVHRHEHSIQMKNYEHPWFGNNSIRFCAFNQYLDEHEGRCMIIPGGGTAISIDDDTTCEIEALRPHPSLPSSYYACRKTKTILAECRSGQRFENRLKRCAIDVTSSEDDFSGDEDSPEAYNHIHLPACERPGRFPVPHGNCTIFYACTSNGFRLFRTIYRCPPSTGFDPFTKMCSPQFACDNDSESGAQLTKMKPESESTTFDPRNAAITTTTQSFTTIAPSTIDLQKTSPLDTSTLFSVSSDDFGYDITTEMIKTSTTSGFNEVETTSVASPLDLITESEFLTSTDPIIGADRLLTISTTQDYENEGTTPTYEAEFTAKDPQDAETKTQTFTTFAPPTIDLQETSPFDTSTPSSVSEESTIPNSRSLDNSSDDSSTEMIKTTTTSGFNEMETTSVAPPLDFITESEFLTTTDNIVGGNQLLTLSTTQNYENQETTPNYESSSTGKDVQTSEDPSIHETSSADETSASNSVKKDQETTTINSEISTVAEIILSNKNIEEEGTTIGYFTTIKPETEDTTPSYLSEKTSQADKITTTEKWLFDFNPTEVSTIESSDSPHFSETLSTPPSTFLTTEELIPTTESSIIGATNILDVLPTLLLPERDVAPTSGEILLKDPSTTTDEAETTSILEENTDGSVTPPTFGEKWLFDATRTEESSTILLSTTEIPVTSVSSFIVDRKSADVVPTTLAPEMEATTTSSEILLKDPLTTTVESETKSTLKENTPDNVTPTTLGGKWLFDATRAEESSGMVLTTTEIPATSESSLIVDRKTPDTIESTTEANSKVETKVASDFGEILRDNLLTTSGDWETTTSNILQSAIENFVTSTTVVNDYANEDFLESESSTENSSMDKNADDGKIASIDTTTVIPKTSDSDLRPIVQESPKNLVTLMTTFFEEESKESESTTENSWSSISDFGSGDGFDATSDPLESILRSNEPIEYNETTDNYDETTVLPVSKSDDEIAGLPEKELDSRNFNDRTTFSPENMLNDGGSYDRTTILPENEQNTDELNDQTTILPENELTASEFNNQTSILPEDELKTSEIDDKTTKSSEDELKNSGLNEDTSMLPENKFTTSEPDDGASELPKDDSSTSTSSYTSTTSTKSTMSTTEATELSSEVTDDLSTATESSSSTISPTMDFETDTTEATYSTSENPNETETYSDMTSNLQSMTDPSLLFSTSEEPAFSDDYTTALPYTIRP